MTSPNNDSNLEDTLAQSYPEVQRHQISFSLQDHVVHGIGRGSAQDLMFRPNASFHPIREIKRTSDSCELHLDRPLMTLSRAVSEREVLILLKSLRLGVRECALGQELYLYPGLESFGVNLSGELKMVLINVRPKHRLKNHTIQQMSVYAFFALLKNHCAKSWARIEPHADRIVTLAALEAHLTGPTVFSRLRRLVRTLALLIIIAFLTSIPIAMFGPPSIRDPLREVLHPVFTEVSQLLSPAQAPIKPLTQSPVSPSEQTPSLLPASPPPSVESPVTHPVKSPQSSP